MKPAERPRKTHEIGSAKLFYENRKHGGKLNSLEKSCQTATDDRGFSVIVVFSLNSTRFLEEALISNHCKLSADGDISLSNTLLEVTGSDRLSFAPFLCDRASRDRLGKNPPIDGAARLFVIRMRTLI